MNEILSHSFFLFYFKRKIKKKKNYFKRKIKIHLFIKIK
jgi:hypothetical protein